MVTSLRVGKVTMMRPDQSYGKAVATTTTDIALAVAGDIKEIHMEKTKEFPELGDTYEYIISERTSLALLQRMMIYLDLEDIDVFH